MAASGSSRRHCPWPDLPLDLLGLVLTRLPSHADRIRLSAVCLAWRSSVRLQRPLPPTLPWLSLRDGTFLSLPNGAVHRLPVPGDVLCRVSTGSALFLVHADGNRTLMSPSSLATIRAVLPEINFYERTSLNKESAQNIRKAVVSEHLAAVLVKSKIDRFEDVIFTRRRQGFKTNSSSVMTSMSENKFIADIAIFKEDLYILTQERVLFVLNHQHHEWGIYGTPRDDHEKYLSKKVKKKYYLVVSGDQLLMVKRLICLPSTLPRDKGSQKAASRFEVFEATDLRSSRGRWTKVDNLMGRALFVSEGCSESLPTVGSTIGVQENCIYFLSEYTYSAKRIHESLFPDYGVYNMREQTIAPLPFEMVERDGGFLDLWRSFVKIGTCRMFSEWVVIAFTDEEGTLPK